MFHCETDAPWSRVPNATLAANVDPTGSILTPQNWIAGSLGGVVQRNDKILAVVHVETGGTTSNWSATGLSDSLGNVYTRDLVQVWTPTNTEEMSVWSAVVTVTGTPANLTVTVASLGGVQDVGIALTAAAYRGLSTAPGQAGIDLSRQATTLVAATPIDSGTTAGTTTAPHQLKVGFLSSFDTPFTVSPGTLDTSYSLVIKQDGIGPHYVQCLEDADAGPLGSTARATVLPSVAKIAGMAVVVYK